MLRSSSAALTLHILTVATALRSVVFQRSNEKHLVAITQHDKVTDKYKARVDFAHHIIKSSTTISNVKDFDWFLTFRQGAFRYVTNTFLILDGVLCVLKVKHIYLKKTLYCNTSLKEKRNKLKMAFLQKASNLVTDSMEQLFYRWVNIIIMQSRANIKYQFLYHDCELRRWWTVSQAAFTTYLETLRCLLLETKKAAYYRVRLYNICILRWGRFVAHHPYPVIATTILITALSSIGFLNFR